ncbi:MAG: nitrilase [Thermoproteus sp. JCHS_4]|nr:MAG: nitrilase [Thermoproteus sp. JCHS_4]
MRLALIQSPRFSSPANGLRWLMDNMPRADLAVLPEYWVGTAPLDGEGFRRYISGIAEAAAASGATVVAGAVAVVAGDVVRNICPVVGREGLLTWGEKIFPSAATEERARVAGGSNLALFKVLDWAVGCLACVDLVYPELARRLALAGADVVVNPASISADRRGLWAALGLARAFENSIFVAAALGTGYSYPDGRPARGGSFVASPNGALLEFGEEPGVYLAELDRGEVERARRRRRYLDDARSMPPIGINRHGL